MIEANRRIVALTHELKNVSARLKAASAALVASDTNLLERTGQLKSAEGALVASDTNLLEANEHLERIVEELATANEKLLRASEQIANSEKMQVEFINIAAHELRTPIQPILGVLDLYGVNPLPAKVEDEAEEGAVSVEREHLRLVGRNAARLARLSSDILDATRIESKNLKLNIDKNVDIVRLISYAIRDAKSKVANGNIEFLANFPEEGAEADVDSYRIS
jgi:signal transduction histidine kinase